jgi:hypothetical protein
MKIHVKDITEMIAYTKRNRTLIFRIIHHRIKEFMDRQGDSVHLFDFLLTDYQIIVQNVAVRSEWHISLELALRHFEEIEEYEICIEVKDTYDEVMRRKKQ